MDACGSSRRGKAGKCDARLTKLFADIAPEDASASRISSGKSHAQRLDDVFGSLNQTLSGAAPQAAPSLAALEAPAPTPAAPSRRPPSKKPRRKANAPRRPPPKAGYTTGPGPAAAAAERRRDVFPAGWRERKGGERQPRADDADDAARPEAASARRRRSRRRAPCRSRTSTMRMMEWERARTGGWGPGQQLLKRKAQLVAWPGTAAPPHSCAPSAATSGANRTVQVSVTPAAVPGKQV